jgi:Sulfotransferase family
MQLVDTESLFRQAKVAILLFRERYFRRYVFIHINKTAGSSIEKALGMRFDHKTAMEKVGEIGKDRWDRKFSFAFVRNPWDKVVSHYHYRLKTNKTALRDYPIPFPEWVERAYADRDPRFFDPPKMFMPQWNWIADDQSGILVTFVGRFERLADDFKIVCNRIHRHATLPHLKKSSHGEYRRYYNDRSAAIVRRYFARDIAEFGYEF